VSLVFNFKALKHKGSQRKKSISEDFLDNLRPDSLQETVKVLNNELTILTM